MRLPGVDAHFPTVVDDGPTEDPEGRPTLVSPPIAQRTAAICRNRAALLKLTGPTDDQLIFLTPETLQIGRGREAGLRIDDAEVSRAHAELRFEGGRHVLVDVGSLNGVSVQGEPITSTPLEDGDVLGFGSHTTFRYTLLDDKLEEVLRSLCESSVRDSLTGAYNRRHFDDRLRTETAYALRHRADLGLLLIDIDLFKSVNDTYGHRAGDAVLAFLGGLMSSRLRAEDMFARYGGEEFAAVLRGIDIAGAARAGERLRGIVAGTSAIYEGVLIPVTISIGAVSLRTLDEPGADSLVRTADERLYVAKRDGRNRVVAR